MKSLIACTLAVLFLSNNVFADMGKLKPKDHNETLFDMVSRMYLEGLQNGRNFDLEDLSVPKSGRCFVPHKADLYFGAAVVKDKRPKLGPIAARNQAAREKIKEKIMLWGSWRFTRNNIEIYDKRPKETRDDFLKNHYGNWHWGHSTELNFSEASESANGSVDWMFDFENNDRQDIHYKMTSYADPADNQEYLVLVGQNLIAQHYPVRREYKVPSGWTYLEDFFGDAEKGKKRFDAGENVIACYFYKDTEFKAEEN